MPFQYSHSCQLCPPSSSVCRRRKSLAQSGEGVRPPGQCSYRIHWHGRELSAQLQLSQGYSFTRIYTDFQTLSQTVKLISKSILLRELTQCRRHDFNGGCKEPPHPKKENIESRKVQRSIHAHALAYSLLQHRTRYQISSTRLARTMFLPNSLQHPRSRTQ